MINLINELINILEGKLGFHLPNMVFWIIVIIVFGMLLKKVWKDNIIPVLKSIHSINMQLDKINRIDKVEEEYMKLKEESEKSDLLLDEKIHAIDGKLDILVEKLDRKISQDDEVRRGELKDRIRQSYGYYHKQGYITNMELESLQGLINSYEKSGGANSFVHTVVEPEMYTWEVRD